MKTIELLYSSCIYSTQKAYMTKDVSNFPCINYVYKSGDLKLLYAESDFGHFGVPKLILSGGAGGYRYLDEWGEYGMTEYVFAIVAEIDILRKIDLALDHPKMKQILNATKLFDSKLYNRNIFKHFKYNFYKEYI